MDIKPKNMSPKEKAEALYSRVRTLGYHKDFISDDLNKFTKRVCQLMVTEIMISKMVYLTDEQVMFWRQVQYEIENI